MTSGNIRAPSEASKNDHDERYAFEFDLVPVTAD